MIIVTSAVLIPVSFISLLMILARSYGTASTTLAGFFGIIVAPPLTFLAGIGFLRRWRWSWLYVVALLLCIMAFNAWGLLFAPPETTTTTSASGVKTTMLTNFGSDPHHLPILAICSVLLAATFSRSVRSEFWYPAKPTTLPNYPTTVGTSPAVFPPIITPELPAHATRGWRVGHRGRDCMYYEEKIQGNWERLEIDGEMLTGRAHHVIYFASPERWQTYPEWARHRREEIICRIKADCNPPDYEYQEDSRQAAPAQVGNVPIQTAHAPAALPTKSLRGLFIVITLLLILTGWMGWLVKTGLETGVTKLPMKRASLQRPTNRAEEPAMFFVSIGIYSVIGLGSLGLAVWVLRETFRPAR